MVLAPPEGPDRATAVAPAYRDASMDGFEAWAPDPPQKPPEDGYQEVPCGRCGWTNRVKVQRGMRALSFVCQWCEKRTFAIVDAAMKRTIIP